MASVGQGSATTALIVLSSGRHMSKKGRSTDLPFCDSILQKRSTSIPHKRFSAKLQFDHKYFQLRFQDFVGHTKDPFIKGKVEWGLPTSGMLRGVGWGH
jgi:hypothetical protein